MILNRVLIGFSQTAVGILGIYFKLQSFLFMPIFGMNNGVMPIMGYNYGAKNRRRLMETYRDALMIAICIMLVGLLLFQLFPDKLLAVFNADDEMYELGRQALTTISFSFIFAAVSIINGTLFQATAHGLNSLIVTSLRQIIVLIPLAVILSNSLGVYGVWLAFPIAEACAAVISLLLVRGIYKKDIAVMEDQ